MTPVRGTQQGEGGRRQRAVRSPQSYSQPSRELWSGGTLPRGWARGAILEGGVILGKAAVFSPGGPQIGLTT